jgi:hypothetical protein
MSFIDELTRRISTEVQRNLDSAIRDAIEAYIVGPDEGSRGVSAATPGKRRRRNSTRQGSRTAGDARAKRNKLIIDAVTKIGTATVEDVAAKTGLDKRGVGSSLYYLSQAGNLRRTKKGTYKV